MLNKPNIIGLGAIAVDDLLFLETFPEPDTKQKVVKRVRKAGGLAGTALVAAARLGARPAYFGVLGKNELSEFTISEFHKENVQTDLCIFDEKAKPIHSTILIDQSTGSRTILYSVVDLIIPKALDISTEAFEGCKMIFIDTFALEIFPHICQIAQSAKIPIIADIEDTGILDQQSALNLVDYLIFNINMARKITGLKEPKEILDALETPQRKVSVLTAGAGGCWFKENGETAHFMPAFQVDVVDTTGCGDVFHGAFAAAILDENNIPDAVIRASAAAAIKATRPDGQAGIPDQDKLTKFLDQNKNIQPETIS